MESGLFITDPKGTKADPSESKESSAPEIPAEEEMEKATISDEQNSENLQTNNKENQEENSEKEEEKSEKSSDSSQENENQQDKNENEEEKVPNNEEKTEQKELEKPPSQQQKPKAKPKPRPKKKTEPPPPSLSDEEIENIINEMLNGRNPEEYPSDTLSQTVNVLKLKKQNYIQDKKYIDAQRVTQLTKDVLYYISKNSYSEQYEAKIKQLTQKRDEAQKDLDELNERWQKKMDDFHQLVEDKVNNVCEQNDQQLAEFDEKVQKQIDETVIRENKILMDLKSRENGYVANDMFTEAAKIRTKIDKLEGKMLEQEKVKKREDADIKRRKMIETQIVQLKVIEQWSNEKSIDMSRQMASEVLAAQNRVKNLNLQIEEAKKSATNPSIQKLHHAQRKSQAKRAGALVVPSVGMKRGPRKTASSRLK